MQYTNNTIRTLLPPFPTQALESRTGEPYLPYPTLPYPTLPLESRTGEGRPRMEARMLLLARGMEARMLLLARDPLPAPRNTTQSAPGDVDLIISSSPLQGLEFRD